jgi:hypothetical protein
MSLTTLASTKAYIGGSFSSADDSLLASLILSADAVIAELVDRILTLGDYTETLDGSGRNNLMLPQYPINSVAEIKISSQWDWANTTALDLTRVLIKSKQGILVFNGGSTFVYGGGHGDSSECGWPRGNGNIRVTWNAGYSSIPSDVSLAANMTVADWFTRAKQLASGQSQNEMISENIGDRTEQYATEATAFGIPKQAVAYLMNYKRTF